MKKKPVCIIMVVSVLFLPFTFTGQNIPGKYIIANGAATGQNQTYELRSSVGQPLLRTIQNPFFTIESGFWNSSDIATSAQNQNPAYIQNKLEIYPNPANSYIMVDINGQGTIEILDLKGSLISQFVITGRKKIDVSQLVSGVYLVRSRFDQLSLVRKIVLY
jgi:hypothetical protein